MAGELINKMTRLLITNPHRGLNQFLEMLEKGREEGRERGEREEEGKRVRKEKMNRYVKREKKRAGDVQHGT